MKKDYTITKCMVKGGKIKNLMKNMVSFFFFVSLFFFGDRMNRDEPVARDNIHSLTRSTGRLVA